MWGISEGTGQVGVRNEGQVVTSRQMKQKKIPKDSSLLREISASLRRSNCVLFQRGGGRPLNGQGLSFALTDLAAVEPSLISI
jgi:hypothetical protein